MLLALNNVSFLNTPLCIARLIPTQLIPTQLIPSYYMQGAREQDCYFLLGKMT